MNAPSGPRVSRQREPSCRCQIVLDPFKQLYREMGGYHERGRECGRP